MAPFASRLLATALPLALLAAGAAATAYALARRRVDGQPGHAGRAAIRALLATYVLALAWWTIVLSNPNQDGVRHANLVPFREIARSLTDREPGYGILNFWGNVVAFIPIGALALLAMRRGKRWTWLIALASGILLSGTLEIAQYSVGRSADVDDVILNAAGAALGVALAAIGRRGSSSASPRSHTEIRRFP